ncbi:MAG TPA: hypothetical protein DEP35_09590 [Deltaproteobacteria bacterium]|nr:hypothetical protein [Deltaproteobacteria bacterium]
MRRHAARTPPAAHAVWKAANLAFAVAAATLLGSTGARAHAFAPSLLELRELSSGEVALRWKTPRIAARGSRVEPVLPPQCTAAGPPEVGGDEGAVVELSVLRCTPEGLIGKAFGARGLEGAGTNVLLHITLLDGRVLRTVLTTSSPSFLVPAQESVGAVFGAYGRLGVVHLWTGADHVLFVGGLLLVVRGRRRLALAITSFTLGHSVTLALASLGWISLSPPLVEVAIAGSLVAVALEAVRTQAGAAPGAIARAPWRLCFAFGLLHGLGFAGALRQVGLPQNAVPLALIGFNAGIELGQLGIVAVAGAAALVLGRAGGRGLRRVQALTAEVVGTLGIYLCLDRIAALW